MDYVRTPHESLFIYDQEDLKYYDSTNLVAIFVFNISLSHACFDLGMVVGKYKEDEHS